MLGSLIGLILIFIILGVIWWAVVVKLLPLIPLGEPFATIVHVLIVLLMVLIVIYAIVTLLGFAGIHVPTFGRL